MNSQVYILLVCTGVILGVGVFSEILSMVLPSRLQGREHRIALMVMGLIILAYIGYYLGFIDLSSVRR